MPKMLQKMIVHYVSYEADYTLTGELHFAREHAQFNAIINQLKAQNAYVPVAAIEFDERKPLESNLEHAYEVMQNGVVTDSWTLSPPDGLQPLVDPIDHEGSAMGHRSMSIGDIITVGGNQYVVAFMGFKKVA